MNMIEIEGRSRHLEKRVRELVLTGRKQAAAVIDRLETEVVGDEVVPIGPDAGTDRPSVFYDREDGEVGITYRGQNRRFHPHAATQFGAKLGIPSAWLRQSIEGHLWERELIADVMSTTLARTDSRQRLLLRSVGNEVRGVLSDQYRRLDSAGIVAAFVKACEKAGAVPYRAHASDISWSISAIVPTPIIIDAGPHGDEPIVVSVDIRSSDFGAGPLEICFEVVRLACTNGLLGRSAMRQVHLGAKLQDNLQLSAETYRLDSETQASAVTDVTSRLFEPDYVTERIAEVEASTREVIDAQQEIGGLVRARRLNPVEVAFLENALVRNDGAQVPTGPVTRWKFAQALAWVAHAAEASRGTELEKLAGSMVLVGGGSKPEPSMDSVRF